MKFLHISDLHIGKRVNEFSMTEDQKYILNQILQIAQREQVDAVLIAGDIYDKPMPSAEAVQMFDWFLTGLADLGKKVLAVSGNHDSPERIAFGGELMRGRGVYVSPVYRGEALEIALQDSYGEIRVHLLPFVKPATVRHTLEERPEDEGGVRLPESYQEAVEIAIERMKIDGKTRNILVAHQFVTGAGRCDSEEVAVGGLDNVDARVFNAFDYVALGHIHSPQSVGRETVRYCGTPLKYSFSEAEQEKSVTIVELREKGQLTVSTVPLVPLHDMRKIRGSYLEVMSKSFYQDRDREDYVQITLTDEEDIPDGMQRLRTVYPNLMRLVYDNSRTREDRTVEAVGQVEERSEMELFGEFYEMQNNQPMSGEQAAFIEKLIEGLQ
ncbi:MAG: exonuclease SbcCD subunit D [Lachnospiraceae bacterium]|jgi:exonuclease SbcD|nr:exonuclease SbcCD subunit D [uncultured Acetatifactor sp.]MCI9229664.1 exonuclease SbcCD subunit D [Lachnospiraceae bacterium]MCI9571952.1 exonuclease SbcCD subunit D [Lachnospiraceae bacterium]